MSSGNLLFKSDRELSADLGNSVLKFKLKAPGLHERIVEAGKRSDSFYYEYSVVGRTLVIALSGNLPIFEKKCAAQFLLDLGCPSYPGVQEDILAIARDKHHQFRPLAFTLLSSSPLTGKVEAVETLIDGLRDRNPAIREAAIGAVNILGNDLASECVPALQECLVDSVPSIRSKSLSVLKSLGPEAKDAVTAVIKCMLDDATRTIRVEAADTISEIDQGFEKARSHFQAMADEDKRKATLYTLTAIGPAATSLRKKIEHAWDNKSPKHEQANIEPASEKCTTTVQRATAQARMVEVVGKSPEALGWTCKQWAQRLTAMARLITTTSSISEKGSWAPWSSSPMPTTSRAFEITIFRWAAERMRQRCGESARLDDWFQFSCRQNSANQSPAGASPAISTAFFRQSSVSWLERPKKTAVMQRSQI